MYREQPPHTSGLALLHNPHRPHALDRAPSGPRGPGPCPLSLAGLADPLGILALGDLTALLLA